MITTKGPRPIPESVEKLDRDMRFRTKAEIDSANKKRDKLRVEIIKHRDTGKVSDDYSQYLAESNAPKERHTFCAESFDVATQCHELIQQAIIEESAYAEAKEKCRELIPLVDQQSIVTQKLRGQVQGANVTDELFDELLVAEQALTKLSVENQRQHWHAATAKAEAKRLRSAADELVVLIDPTSELEFPMNFAIHGGPKKLVVNGQHQHEVRTQREAKVAAAKRQRDEHDRKINDLKKRLVELNQEHEKVASTFGESRKDEIDRIDMAIEYCGVQLREHEEQLIQWTAKLAEESRRLELLKSAS